MKDSTQKPQVLAAAAFDLAHTSMVVVDTAGRLVAVNQAASALLGLGAEAYDQEKVIDLLSDDSKMIDLSAIGRTALDIDVQELSIQRPDGSQFNAMLRFTPIVAVGQSYTLLSFIDHDSKEVGERGRLAYLATHDPLTGCLNRRGMLWFLGRLLFRARSTRESFGVFFIDLNNFKKINDRYGHQFGDQVLADVAAKLQGCLGKDDWIARPSGDEFVIVTSQATKRADAALIADQLLAALSQGIELQDQTLRVSMNIGISFYPQDAEDAMQLIGKADFAMYRSKRAGESGYAFAGEDLADGVSVLP